MFLRVRAAKEGSILTETLDKLGAQTDTRDIFVIIFTHFCLKHITGYVIWSRLGWINLGGQTAFFLSELRLQ